MSKLKSLVTGKETHSRVLYTHTSHEQRLNMTLCGSVDKPLGTVVYDDAGMRRFVEVSTVPRREDVEPHWHLIEGFDYLSLWQAVDEQAADPLIPFAELIKDKSESMRHTSSVETWLTQFTWTPGVHRNLKHREIDPHGVEFTATQLYPDFRDHEEKFYPGNKGTSLAVFGKLLTAMIDRNRAPQWGRRPYGRSTLYRFQHTPVVVPLTAKAG